MFKLTIDGKTAVIKTGTSIKLTRENPLVTESGDYTFDVQLPLRGCPENIDIFGALYRPEVSISAVAGRRLPFTLITDVFSISGKAVVTSVTQDEAKVQLLAGRSNIKNEDGSDIYIDEIEYDLPWKTIENIRTVYINADRNIGENWDVENKLFGRSMNDWVINLLCQYLINNDSDAELLLHASARMSNFVAFPIYSLEDDKMANAHAVHHRNVGEENEYYMYCFKDTTGGHGKLAIQPYLVYVLEKILEHIGYPIINNNIRDTWMANVFIANAKHTIRVHKILPHWTVEEFIKEIENFFGCFINIKDNSSEIITYNSNGSNRTIELTEIIEESSADIEIDDDERIDSIIAGNIEYAEFLESNILRLPDEIWQKAEVMIFENKNEIDEWIEENLSDSDIRKSKYLFCETENNKVYAHIEIDSQEVPPIFQLKQVDLCPALIRNGQFNKFNRDIDITLRITPCLMMRNNIDYVRTENGTTTRYIDVIDAMIPLSPAERYTSNNDDYSVSDAILEDEDEEEEEKTEIIPIAWNTLRNYEAHNMQTSSDNEIKFAVGLPYCRHNDITFYQINQPNNIENLCLSSRDFENTRFVQNLNTRVVRQFSFTDNINPDPLAIYLIRGKKYLCQKIELTIDEKGVNPLKKGYFYELN